MKSSKNFNVRSTGFDYTKQRGQELPLHKEEEKGDGLALREKKMEELIYIRRPTIAYRSNDKKLNNRFQK